MPLFKSPHSQEICCSSNLPLLFFFLFLFPNQVKDLVGEPQARETLEAAEVCLRLDTTSPPYVGLLVTKIAEYLRVPRGQEEPPPPDLSKAPLLSAEVIPLLPEIKEIDFADETTLHKVIWRGRLTKFYH